MRTSTRSTTIHLALAAFAVQCLAGAFVACSDDSTSDPNGADAAAEDAGVDGTTSFDGTVATEDASSDAAAATDAPIDTSPTSDGATDAANSDAADGGSLDAAADAKIDAADGAVVDSGADASTLISEERVSVAACPWAVTVAGSKVFWTETTSAGCTTPAVRSCSTTTPCASLPAAIYSSTSGQSLPFGIVALSESGPVYYTDNQVPNDSLWSLEIDGGRSNMLPIFYNGAGLASDGASLYWGTSAGLFKVPLGAGAGGTIFAADMAGSVDNGPNTVAVDGVRVFAAAAGKELHACTIGGTCDTSSAVVLATVATDAGSPQIGGVASDGAFAYFTSGMAYYTATGRERLWRCAVTGCPSGPELLTERVTDISGLKGSQFGVAVDANRVYFGTVQGTIESCPKTGGACTPQVLVKDARPFGFTIAGPYLYWADWRGGIYRIVRP